ncbi:MAG: hypothetical protein AAGA56_01670 [Myxococcota bacterium]
MGVATWLGCGLFMLAACSTGPSNGVDSAPASGAPTAPASGGAATSVSVVPAPSSSVAVVPSGAASGSVLPGADPLPRELGEPCGELGCLRFATAQGALAHVLLQSAPVVVLAVGEAHAQKGTEAVESATSRFTRELLPLLKGRASDVVLELLVADGSCGQAEKRTAKMQKPVTKRQAKSNQNQFIALGKRAETLSLRPHTLRPDCDDYQRVAAAGPDGIVEMLQMIATLSEDKMKRILERNRRLEREAMVLAYGGAIHNDVAPSDERKSWSFGPQMKAATGGRYVELDLIVPEFIKDTPTWKKLPWYERFDRSQPPAKVTLFRTDDGAYTLIFGRSGGALSP